MHISSWMNKHSYGCYNSNSISSVARFFFTANWISEKNGSPSYSKAMRSGFSETARLNKEKNEDPSLFVDSPVRTAWPVETSICDKKVVLGHIPKTRTWIDCVQGHTSLYMYKIFIWNVFQSSYLLFQTQCVCKIYKRHSYYILQTMFFFITKYAHCTIINKYTDRAKLTEKNIPYSFQGFFHKSCLSRYFQIRPLYFSLVLWWNSSETQAVNENEKKKKR